MSGTEDAKNKENVITNITEKHLYLAYENLNKDDFGGNNADDKIWISDS